MLCSANIKSEHATSESLEEVENILCSNFVHNLINDFPNSATSILLFVSFSLFQFGLTAVYKTYAL